MQNYNFPVFITVDEQTPIGNTPKRRKVNLEEVESFASVGDTTTIYLRSGRKIENILATETEIENKISSARSDLFYKIAKYSR